jgi:hypothetical protein
MGCSISVIDTTPFMEGEKIEAFHILSGMELSESDRSKSVVHYALGGLQDAQYSPNMSAEDRANLRRLWEICEKWPQIRGLSVDELLMDGEELFSKAMQREAEDNMIAALKSDPKLLAWFKEYTPSQYAYNPDPNLTKLGDLVESDGHSGASFALCCRAVKNRI